MPLSLVYCLIEATKAKTASAKTKHKNRCWKMCWPPIELLLSHSDVYVFGRVTAVWGQGCLGKLQCCLQAEGQLCLQDGAEARPCYTWLHFVAGMLTRNGARARACCRLACWRSHGSFSAPSITWPSSSLSSRSWECYPQWSLMVVTDQYRNNGTP